MQLMTLEWSLCSVLMALPSGHTAEVVVESRYKHRSRRLVITVIAEASVGKHILKSLSQQYGLILFGMDTWVVPLLRHESL